MVASRLMWFFCKNKVRSDAADLAIMIALRELERKMGCLMTQAEEVIERVQLLEDKATTVATKLDAVLAILATLRTEGNGASDEQLAEIMSGVNDALTALSGAEAKEDAAIAEAAEAGSGGSEEPTP